MEIHCVGESVHIRMEQDQSELEPWALGFLSTFSNFSGGMRREITPLRARREAMYS